MKEFYKRKFKNKSRFELELIVEHASDYDPEAVQVARSLILQKENEPKQTEKDNDDTKDEIEQLLIDSKVFIKNYRINNFINYIVLILLVYSTSLFFNFYKDELGSFKIGIYYFNLIWIGLLINHLLYILETKKVYTIFSRLVNDFFFIITIIAFLILIGRASISPIIEAFTSLTGVATTIVLIMLVVAIECLFSITYTFVNFLWKQIVYGNNYKN
ncbi:hypothetical protein [Flammeovirga sp. EKP202]|uniref:hypothetical protein n=1 Tax=Flammeovirga sp. EKP202 TaxID=2770592 RepID=UPI00165F11BB|nr:hypothetical protein [Flammeovirga sp. EKP202]MBD0404782.1 hypothetical protein [Flammeovirga sp. EKP202]